MPNDIILVGETPLVINVINPPLVTLSIEASVRPIIDVISSSSHIITIVTPPNPVIEIVSNRGLPGIQGEIGPKGESGVTVSNTAPLSPSIGDLWIDTN